MYSGTKVRELTPIDFAHDEGKRPQVRQPVQLIGSDFAGKYGILEVYAPWCPHCRHTVPDMAFLAENLKREGINVCALNVEYRVKDVKINEPIAAALGADGYPSFFMINTDGSLEYVETDRSVEGILNTICSKTQQYSRMNRTAPKCCTRSGNRITC